MQNRLLVPELFFHDPTFLNWRWHNWRDSRSYEEWVIEKRAVITANDNFNYKKEMENKQFKAPTQAVPPIKRIMKPISCDITSEQGNKMIEHICDQKKEIMMLKRRHADLDARLSQMEKVLDFPTMTAGQIVIDDDLVFEDAEEFNRFYQELHQY